MWPLLRKRPLSIKICSTLRGIFIRRLLHPRFGEFRPTWASAQMGPDPCGPWPMWAWAHIGLGLCIAVKLNTNNVICKDTCILSTSIRHGYAQVNTSRSYLPYLTPERYVIFASLALRELFDVYTTWPQRNILYLPHLTWEKNNMPWFSFFTKSFRILVRVADWRPRDVFDIYHTWP